MMYSVSVLRRITLALTENRDVRGSVGEDLDVDLRALTVVFGFGPYSV